MANPARGLRLRVLAVVAPANALLVAAACGGQANRSASDSHAGQANQSGTGGTAEPAGSVAGTGSGGVLAAGGASIVSVGGDAGFGGVLAGGSAGVVGVGGIGVGGSTVGGTSGGRAPASSGGTTGYNCSTNAVGTCCDSDVCLAPDAARELLGATVGAGGLGGVSAGGAGAGGDGTEACPIPNAFQQLSICSFIHSGPIEQNGACCYVVTSGGCCGRPLVIAGAARQSELVERDGWQAAEADTPDGAKLSATERAELARAWAADALMEHASIASFARFSLELLAAGAPASFVEAAQRASLDEVEHARQCFSLASRFAGQRLGPSSLDMGGLQIGQSLVDLAVSVFYEGCIGETLAAALAHEQLLVAVDEQARATLERIAADEAEHSLLAWRFLRHAVELGGGEVVQRLRRALSEAPEHVAPPAVQVPPALWNCYGRLTPQQERGVVEATWRDVIAPATELLLRHCAESHRNTERRAEA